MLPSLIITAFAIFGGLLLTYLYDDESPLPARLCAGACIGLSVLGLTAFVLASFGGFTRSVILLSTAITSLPIALLRRNDIRKSCEGDLRVFIDWSKRVARKPSGRQIFTLIFFAAF